MNTKIIAAILCVATIGMAYLLLIQRKQDAGKSPIQITQDSLLYYTSKVTTLTDSAKHYAQQADYYRQKRDSIAFLVYLNSRDLDPYRDSLRTIIRRKIEAKARSNTGNR